MKIQGYPHCCGGTLLIGFDAWNGQNGDELGLGEFKPEPTEGTMYEDLVTPSRGINWILSKHFLMATLHTDQIIGEKFLTTLGFTSTPVLTKLDYDRGMRVWTASGPTVHKELFKIQQLCGEGVSDEVLENVERFFQVGFTEEENMKFAGDAEAYQQSYGRDRGD